MMCSIQLNKLQSCIEYIANNNDTETYEEEAYEILSEIQYSEPLNEIIPIIYNLCKCEKLSKYYVYLSLLANEDVNVLQRFSTYDKSVADINSLNEIEIFEYVVYKKKHWFLKILEKYDTLGKSSFNSEIYQKILMIKLIELTNSAEIETEKIKSVLSAITNCDDEFMRLYKKEIEFTLKLVAFLQELNKETNKTTQMFNFVIRNSLLKSFCEFLSLAERKNWKRIAEFLRENSRNVDEENDVFICFTIIHTILEMITTKNYFDGVLEQSKEDFLRITDPKLKLLVIKLTFTLIFLQKHHLKHNDLANNEYLNNTRTLSTILQFLKATFDTIKLQKIFHKNTEEYNVFVELNKNLADAIWRYELIADVKLSKCTILRRHPISYMLAPPESLLNLCLKGGDFERAEQVVKIFGLEETYLAKEIEHTVALSNLKELYRRNQNQKNVIDFFSHSVRTCVGFEELPTFFREDNERFMNTFDFAITQCNNYQNSKALLDAAFLNSSFGDNTNCNYVVFCNRFRSAFNEIGKKTKLSAREFLVSPMFRLNIEEFGKEEEFLEQLEIMYRKFMEDLNTYKSGTLNSNHDSHSSYKKLRELCERYSDVSLNPESAPYLAKLFVYLKAFSKVLYIGQNNSAIISKGKNSSFFEILQYNRAELMGKLLFENNLDPADFEDYFAKLKLDLLYHIVGNCFPTINLHKQVKISSDELYPENQLHVPTSTIMTYVQKRNWLLAYILSEMYKVHALKVDIDESRVRHFTNYMQLLRIQHLKVLFDDSELITALQNEIEPEKVMSFVHKHMEIHSTNTTSSDEDNVEKAKEMSEENVKGVDWKYLYDLVNSIPQNQLVKSSDYRYLKDLILKRMVSELYEFKYYKYVQHIYDSRLRIETILGSLDSWPVEFCIQLVMSELSRLDGNVLDPKLLKAWLDKLEIYEMIMNITKQGSWYEVHELCHRNPEEIIKLIISEKNIDSLQKFLNVFGVAVENLQDCIDAEFLAEVLEQNESFTKVEKILNDIPQNASVKICYDLLKQLKNIKHHQKVVDYLLKRDDSDGEKLKNIQISLKILSHFPQNEQDQLWCLLTTPLNILEVLLMNTKLDKLGSVLESIKADLKDNENEENVISVSTIDEMLRSYAEKSLDFRVVLQPHTQQTKMVENKLLESLDSVSFSTEQKNFIMPNIVPSKEEWTADNEVTSCMCCCQSAFSMFNRRHHCRRCGRLVCHSCSQKRMLVDSYGSILVRVCDDCFEQTHSSSKSDTSSSKSLTYDFWLLTDNEEQNRIVREEFSYEYAPSVSLCLAILKHHSKTKEYPEFLLGQCEAMLKLLRPRAEVTHEIDHLLVIRMLKSLAVAAKMLCAECMLHWGISLADRILSQADLLNLLIERGCLGLLPVTSQTESTFIDTSVLRRLRDRLLEDEQWHLALEVSTKAGLDNTGVFAAWGKSCLKAGSLQLAREKFQRCFMKTFDVSNELEGSFSRRLRTISSSSSSSDIRQKDPPLLHEIIQILEGNTVPINKKVLKKLETAKHITSSTFSLNQSFNFTLQSDPAICVLNKLKNLEAIVAGNLYEDNDDDDDSGCFKPRINELFYKECIYYLQKYGSPFSLLQFYVRQRDYRGALNYVLDEKVIPEVFTEIYMICLKEGVVNDLHACLREIDPSLDIWKDYFMNICRTLEMQYKLHSLYQLQLFIGDCVRAAVTSIKFYKENARTFSELIERENYLQQAEMHLNQDLEQQQWVEVAAKSIGSMESFEEKSITNPSLVMKMSSKSIGKHINTIWRQMEVTRFLAKCEKEGRVNLEVLGEIMPQDESAEQQVNPRLPTLPTLFDGTNEKIQLVVLTIISGETVSEGFDLAQKIILEFKLKATKVYSLTGRLLAKKERYGSIPDFVSCIRTGHQDEKVVNEMCDEMLSFALCTLVKANAPGSAMEALIRLISDKGTKISAYIEAKQLKSAYFLAMKYKRVPDIRRIMREAELLNQPSIKALCQKFIQSHSHSANNS